MKGTRSSNVSLTGRKGKEGGGGKGRRSRASGRDARRGRASRRGRARGRWGGGHVVSGGGAGARRGYGNRGDMTVRGRAARGWEGLGEGGRREVAAPEKTESAIRKGGEGVAGSEGGACGTGRRVRRRRMGGPGIGVRLGGRVGGGSTVGGKGVAVVA